MAPNFVGLYQLNVRAPEGFSETFPRVQIRALGAASNTPTIGTPPPPPLPPFEFGTHFADPEEFRQIGDLGLDFIVTTVNETRESWDSEFDAAQQAGVKLIVGMFPEPYRLTGNRWIITDAGRRFLL